MTRQEQIIDAAYIEAEIERQLEMYPQVFEQGFVAGAKWADAHPDISVVSALAYEAGREGAINDASEWLKGNLHLAIDCDDEGRYHIDPNFVDYFKVRMGEGGTRLPYEKEEIKGNQGEISPNRIIGTEKHIKVALDVLDKKGGEQ